MTMRNNTTGLAAILGLCALLLSLMAHAQADDERSRLLQTLQPLIPGLAAGDLNPAPVPGFYEVTLGSQLVYVSADGRYLFNGSLVDLKTRTDLTEQRRDRLRKNLLDGLDEKDMIIFEPAETRYNLTVFTDIDCGYCRKLHKQMPEMLAAGIRVRYLPYPRAGEGSKSFRKAVSVWCSDKPREALTAAKNGVDPEPRDCANPVARGLRLGEAFGVSGTPTLVMESGRVLPGYVPVQRLVRILEQDEAR